MSEWYETEPIDIAIDFNNGEVSLYVKQNDFGTVYKTLTFAQVNKLCEDIKKGPNNGK